MENLGSFAVLERILMVLVQEEVNLAMVCAEVSPQNGEQRKNPLISVALYVGRGRANIFDSCRFDAQEVNKLLSRAGLVRQSLTGDEIAKMPGVSVWLPHSTSARYQTVDGLHHQMMML